MLSQILGFATPWTVAHQDPLVYGISQPRILECVAIFFTSGFPGRSVVKNCLQMQEMQVWSLGQEDPLEKEMETHCSILAWEIPRTEEPGRLQPMGLQKSQTWLNSNNKYLDLNSHDLCYFYFYLLTRVEKW